MLTFAEFLAKRRAALGMSMTELAAHLSITPQYISLLESGRCHPSKKLQERCARFFGEELDYIRFLAQNLPPVQKEALLRSPVAFPFLSRRFQEPREALLPSDAEDAFIRELFRYVEEGNLTSERRLFYERLLAEIASTREGRPRFSAKARAWGTFYEILLSSDEPASVAKRLEALWAQIEAEPYPDELRWETSRRLARVQKDLGALVEAASSYERAASYARLLEDTSGLLDAYQEAFRAYRDVGRVEEALSMLRRAVETEGIPAVVRAHLYVDQARLLYELGDFERAVEPVRQAVRIWRLRSLEVPDKTARLVSTQVLGLHLFVERQESLEARQWLGRIRSTLSRITEEDLPLAWKRRYIAESDLHSAVLMVAQGRWNHARKHVEEVREQFDNEVLAFADADDKTLFHLRLMLWGGFAVRGQGHLSEARARAQNVIESASLNDPVRQKGLRSRLMMGVSRLLRLCGDEKAAQTVLEQLLQELDPSRQPSDIFRLLCESDSLRRLREEIVLDRGKDVC